MEKSISSRFYFDYNATSPLSSKVIDYLRSGEFFFGNPSSIHSTGKQAKKLISETRLFLYSVFSLDPAQFELYFHSGATEAINSYFKGNGLNDFKNNSKSCFFFSSVDHQAVVSMQGDLTSLSHTVNFFEVDQDGLFDLDKLINTINLESQNFDKIYLNYTIVNNESGIVWPIDWAIRIKNETKAFVHIDSVQLIGKIDKWSTISSLIDSYTFSGHKFGAMKGVGFTFLKKNSPSFSLITGGNQQNGFRSGTENVQGIYTLKLALESILVDFNTLNTAKNIIEKSIKETLREKVIIVGENSKFRNGNTIFFIIPGVKAELISMKFDLALMDVSTGSACSSGVIKENRVLMNMGFSLENSKSCIRLSFSPSLSMDEAVIYSQKIKAVLDQFA